jgi:hypothetical protein
VRSPGVAVDIFAHVKALAMSGMDWKTELQSDNKFVTGSFQASQRDVRSDEIPKPQPVAGEEGPSSFPAHAGVIPTEEKS